MKVGILKQTYKMVMVMVLNATFNNISVLLVEETEFSVSNGASRFELWKYLVLLLDNRGRRGRDRIVL
jgi:hypothetical protein